MFDSEEQFKYKEQAVEDMLRMSDRFSARYFSLLERFADLPACDELIMAQLKNEFSPEFIASLEAWDEKPMMENQDEFDEKALKDFNPWDEQKPGDLPPGMKLLRQLDMRGRKITGALYQGVFDWCNIQVILLPTDHGSDSMQVLFFLGRAMGAFNASMDALSSHEIHSTVALCKRVLLYLQQVTSLLSSLANEGLSTLKDLMLNRVQQLKALSREIEAQVDDSRNLARLEGQF
jgi:hypothetical protein